MLLRIRLFLLKNIHAYIDTDRERDKDREWGRESERESDKDGRDELDSSNTK